MVHINTYRDPQAPKGSSASSAPGELCPPNLSTGAAAGPQSLAPLRATKEKCVDPGLTRSPRSSESPRPCPQHAGFVPGGCREVTTEALKPHANAATYRSSVHQPVGSLLAVQGVPVRLLPLLPCPAKPRPGFNPTRGINEFRSPKSSGKRKGAHAPASPAPRLPA